MSQILVQAAAAPYLNMYTVPQIPSEGKPRLFCVFHACMWHAQRIGTTCFAGPSFLAGGFPTRLSSWGGATPRELLTKRSHFFVLDFRQLLPAASSPASIR